MSSPTTKAVITITDDAADHVSLKIEFDPDGIDEAAYSHHLAAELGRLAQAICAGKSVEVQDE